jgi:hypothetical protein
MIGLVAAIVRHFPAKHPKTDRRAQGEADAIVRGLRLRERQVAHAKRSPLAANRGR